MGVIIGQINIYYHPIWYALSYVRKNRQQTSQAVYVKLKEESWNSKERCFKCSRKAIAKKIGETKHLDSLRRHIEPSQYIIQLEKLKSIESILTQCLNWIFLYVILGIGRALSYLINSSFIGKIPNVEYTFDWVSSQL